jgi:hypothetical protein
MTFITDSMINKISIDFLFFRKIYIDGTIKFIVNIIIIADDKL